MEKKGSVMLRESACAFSSLVVSPSASGLRGPAVPRPWADPTAPGAVARALLAYLCQHVDAQELAYAEEPEEIVHGWETYIYRFRLRGRGLPAALDRRLVLRIYASPQGVPRARREFAVQDHMYRIGHPVPQPLLLEDDCGIFGGPFLLMAWVPGETLLDRLRRHNSHVFAIAARLAHLHRQLHEAPTAGFPSLPGPFLERRLAEIRSLIDAHGLRGLAAGLDYLDAHRPPEPERPVLLHLDFHPMNVLQAGNAPPTILDWSEADLGDRHADLAATVLLMHATPVPKAGLEWVLAPLARRALIRGYLFCYGRHMRLDRARLRYYAAWAALRRLAVCGMWLEAGPESNGCKPASLRHLQTDHLDVLRECFRHWTGVDVHV